MVSLALHACACTPIIKAITRSGGSVLHSVSWPNYLVIVMPLFALIFSVQSQIRYHRIKFWFVVTALAFTTVISLAFTTLGELAFGIVWSLFLFQRHRNEVLAFLLMWESYLMLTNFMVIAINVGAKIWPQARSGLDLAIPILINVGIWIVAWRAWPKRYDLTTHFAAFNDASTRLLLTWYTAATTLILYGIQISFEALNLADSTTWLLMAEVLLFATANALVLYYGLQAYRANMQAKLTQQAEASRAKYYAELEAQQTHNRHLLHDYKNILATLQLNDDTVANQALLVQAQHALAQSQPDQTVLDHIQCTPLRSLLYLKWTQAENAKRHLQIQTQGQIDLQPADLVMPVLRGVGILLDNAIEAIAIGQSAACLLEATDLRVAITVINPVPPDFSLSALTHTSKGPGHGNGLAIIHELSQDPRIQARTTLHHHQLAQSLIIEVPHA